MFVNNLKLHKFVKNYQLKSYFIQFRPFFVFLLKFFLVYAGLTVLYKLYLNQFEDPLVYKVDGLTQMVANQTQKILQWLNFDCQLQLHAAESSVKVILEGVYVSRVVEGCNAVSVMILFAAFVVAFSGKLKQTLLFIVTGVLIIHVLNILRIVLLNIALLYYPAYQEILHGVVFPAFIYGVVFGLWVIWVNKYSFYATDTEK